MNKRQRKKIDKKKKTLALRRGLEGLGYDFHNSKRLSKKISNDDFLFLRCDYIISHIDENVHSIKKKYPRADFIDEFIIQQINEKVNNLL